MKPREKGEKYRPTVEVLKQKNGLPTKIAVSGKVYALVHEDYINGRKGK